jgi:hypothetical protein
LQEIIMASSRNARSIANKTKVSVCAAASGLMSVSWTGLASASQGPGGGLGTASSLTQLTMAVVVYGALVLVIGAGLIGAARRH